MEELHKAAIEAATHGDWEEAIKLNKQIISLQGSNVQALNRLAFAHLQIGNNRQAEENCRTVLRLEPNHPVAERNLKIASKLRADKKTDKKLGHRRGEKPTSQPKPDVFVKDPGKTRQVILINPATQSILDGLYASQEVQLQPTKKTVEIRTLEGSYIGALPDDISFHLKNLMKLGNHYTTHIKNIDLKRVYVFIREIKRGKRVKQPTFSSGHQTFGGF